MRSSLALLLVTAAALFGAGCSSRGGYDSCNPKRECCWQWQPNCCNSWDWYVPCDSIEGRELRNAQSCDQLPTCVCK